MAWSAAFLLLGCYMTHGCTPIEDVKREAGGTATGRSESDMFGASVAIAGDLMVVGAPRFNLMLFKVVAPSDPAAYTCICRRRDAGFERRRGGRLRAHLGSI